MKLEKIHAFLRHKSPENKELGIHFLYAYAIGKEVYPMFQRLYEALYVERRPYCAERERRTRINNRIRTEMSRKLCESLWNSRFFFKAILTSSHSPKFERSQHFLLCWIHYRTSNYISMYINRKLSDRASKLRIKANKYYEYERH